jgi:hypothetical protein
VFIVGNLGNTGRSPEEILSIKQGRAGYLAQSIAQGKNTSRKVEASIRANNTVAALTVSDLTKGQGSNQAVASNFLQVVDVVHES